MKKTYKVIYNEFKYSQDDGCFVPTQKDITIQARSNVFASSHVYKYFAGKKIIVISVTQI